MADSNSMHNTVRRRARRCTRAPCAPLADVSAKVRRCASTFVSHGARAYVRVVHAQLAHAAAQTVKGNPAEAAGCCCKLRASPLLARRTLPCRSPVRYVKQLALRRRLAALASSHGVGAQRRNLGIAAPALGGLESAITTELQSQDGA